MNAEKDIEIIRKKFPNRPIIYYFEYKNGYVFFVSPLTKYDPKITPYILFVNKNGDMSVFSYLDEMRKDPEGLTRARKRKIFVDVEENKINPKY